MFRRVQDWLLGGLQWVAHIMHEWTALIVTSHATSNDASWLTDWRKVQQDFARSWHRGD